MTMAHRCRVCGETMEVKEGDHYREVGTGRVLYTGVRQYTCPRGCPGAFFDYRKARPAGSPERILGLIPAPRRRLEVVGPLFSLGVALSYLLFLIGIFLVDTGLAVKAVGALLLTALFGALIRFMRAPVDEGEAGPA